MKECCKTGDKQPTPSWRTYLNWLLYAVIAGMLLLAAWSQFS
ncbi:MULTISPECIES: hypothetical protein [Spirosoma]|nr:MULTISPECIES: hypothetical protein [Spirosoma]